jgi:GDPmannose 4,6-dehydratase
MLQQEEPGDYVIATGEQRSVREFVVAAFAEVGIELVFEGSGPDEVGIVSGLDSKVVDEARGGYGPAARGLVPEPLEPGRVLLEVDPRYFRPTEVVSLLGDATKARQRLGWSPSVSFSDLVSEMVRSDLLDEQKIDCVQANGLPFVRRHDS